MSEMVDGELANLLDLAEVVDVIERLTRRVLTLQDVITSEQRKRRDLLAHLAVERQDLLARLAVEQVEHAELAARVAMLETSMAPPWADADDLSAFIDPPYEGPIDMAKVRAACQEISDLAKGNGHG